MLAVIKLRFYSMLVISLLAAAPTKATRSVSAYDLKINHQTTRHATKHANRNTSPNVFIISGPRVQPGALGTALTMMLLLAYVYPAYGDIINGDDDRSHGLVKDSFALSRNVTDSLMVGVPAISLELLPPTNLEDSELNGLTRQLLLKTEELNIAESTQEVIRLLSSGAAVDRIEDSEVINMIPDIESAITTTTFYTDIAVIGGGTRHKVFRARLNQDRGDKKVGQVVALRVGQACCKKEDRIVPRNLRAYGYIAKLSELGVTNYIPKIYGVYFTPFTEALKPEYVTEGPFFVSELEYLETDYERAFGSRGQRPRAPRVAFEEMIGRWAIYKIAKAYLNDADGNVLRHNMLKEDPNYAVYTIGDKSYLFPPGYSPRQVDFDDSHPYSSFKTSDFKNVVRYLNSYQNRESVNNASMRLFLENIPILGLFGSIREHLSEFEVSETNQIPAGAKVSYFRIPDEYIYDE